MIKLKSQIDTTAQTKQPVNANEHPNSIVERQKRSMSSKNKESGLAKELKVNADGRSKLGVVEGG